VEEAPEEYVGVGRGVAVTVAVVGGGEVVVI